MAEQFTLVRDFAAPRELVFACWTEPERLKRWWGPAQFTTPHCSLDLRVGGRLHLCMRGPDGSEFWCGALYREIVPPRLIACTFYMANATGEPQPASVCGMPAGWPDEMETTITFEEHAGGTRLTLSQNVPPSMAKLVMADQGWGQSFDKLAACLDAED